MADSQSSELSHTVTDPAAATDSETRSYDPAFAEDDANIILRSADGIYYRVSAYTLRTTSGFFRTMMNLPQTTAHQNDDIIVLTESSKVLGTLLRMVGGMEFSWWKSLDELEDLLTAAEKYDMPGPRMIIHGHIITSPAPEETLRLYAIAARFEWEEQAKLASKHTLSIPIHDDAHAIALGAIPSSYLLRLFHLHRTRSNAFVALIKSGNQNTYFNISGCGHNLRLGALGCLANLMILELDRQPAGTNLLNGTWRIWPAATTRLCYQSQHCNGTITQHHETIATLIATYINSLPSTI